MQAEAQERLSALPDGRLAYRLKRPLGEGRQAEYASSAVPCAFAVQSEGPAPETPAPDPASGKRHPSADPSRIPWAELLMRVFREDVLACPCGGRRRVLAYLTQPGPVKAILDHLGPPSTGPPLAPARFIAGSAEETWQDDVLVLQNSLR